MAPWRASTTKSEWLPDDPTAFVPTRLWKLPCITTWDDSRSQNHPTDSAEEAYNRVPPFRSLGAIEPIQLLRTGLALARTTRVSARTASTYRHRSSYYGD